PYEARMRLQSGGKNKEHEEALSFHSAIPNNPEHSRRVLAYDVAIGAGESVDDVTFYAYLCRVADWRLDWERTRASANSQFETEQDLPDEAVSEFFLQEDASSRELINSTVTYRKSGALPTVVGDNMPSLVAAQSLKEQRAGNSVRFGGSA
ncbi:DUF3274 domain-containing protein, partial [Pseudomonas protegens]|uniref:effector protein Tle3 domain-containing protein n=1 Tax=Pseudomonas protegens TaxID=380021 RepID=UPI000F4D176E